MNQRSKQRSRPPLWSSPCPFHPMLKDPCGGRPIGLIRLCVRPPCLVPPEPHSLGDRTKLHICFAPIPALGYPLGGLSDILSRSVTCPCVRFSVCVPCAGRADERSHQRIRIKFLLCPLVPLSPHVRRDSIYCGTAEHLTRCPCPPDEVRVLQRSVCGPSQPTVPPP